MGNGEWGMGAIPDSPFPVLRRLYLRPNPVPQLPRPTQVLLVFQSRELARRRVGDLGSSPGKSSLVGGGVAGLVRQGRADLGAKDVVHELVRRPGVPRGPGKREDIHED